MEPQEAHIFFVDDDPTVRTAVQRTLESAGMHVTVFSTAEECLAGLPRHACDVLITDLRMEGLDGISLLQQIKCRFPQVATIVLTGYGDIPSAVEAMKAGAVEFLEKPLDRQELLSAIQRVLKKTVQPKLSPPTGLSRTEVHILHGILEGRTNREIACSLNRSIRTIEAHRRGIMHKLGTKNIAQLIQRALALGFDRDALINGGDSTDIRQRP